jgi:hypothetical protein
LQAVGPQVYGLHDCVWVAGHAPAPLQPAESVATPLLHDASRHVVELSGYAQAVRLAPSHAPPQRLPSLAQVGRAPCGAPPTAVQVPTLPATSQASHWPPQATLQQTPSTQFEFAHWESAEQFEPSISLEMEMPPEHHSPAAQSPSTTQLPLQAVAPQVNGVHDCVCTAGQWPLPSQAAPKVATSAVHEGSRHVVVG